ncbi:polysaccharide deacetylase family protein [Glutamicibacter bergerei]|uniref:Polysaccharide deacetylase family protein n=2 Tax=Glutamicibacter TaxID=1742989 RepID=A0ABV9MGT1_9MICC|nr:polysaccharide deacetylase family protein [Glutamicibacter ardleyensis]GGJ66508.1 hypothetical protein GCM10007173_26770 [Glutamicibacter ardleyensis]HBV09518.1 hypothetical protein [Micrococcaceae bacterium]
MPSRSRVNAVISVLCCVLFLTSCGSPITQQASRAGHAVAGFFANTSSARSEGSMQVARVADYSAVPAVQAPITAMVLKPQPRVNCEKTKCVALTFDDGPGKYTASLLDMLARENVPATFYMLGQNVANFHGAINRMAYEGHQLGNHTFDHRSLTGLSAEEIKNEISATESAIRKATGLTPDTLRPPYGAHNSAVDQLVNTPMVLWDVDTLDWQHHDPKKTVDLALAQAHPGSIILMHDIHDSSVKAVPELVKRLKHENYTLVTVNELFEGTNFGGKTAYTRR